MLVIKIAEKRNKDHFENVFLYIRPPAHPEGLTSDGAKLQTKIRTAKRFGKYFGQFLPKSL